MRLPGITLLRQQPGTAKGVGFVTVEDEYGEANVVVYKAVGARDRQALLGARLLVTEGRVERVDDRAEIPTIHLIARRLEDRSDLLDRLGQLDGAEAGWDRLLSRADEVRRPEPGSRRPVRLPLSRDFR